MTQDKERLGIEEQLDLVQDLASADGMEIDRLSALDALSYYALRGSSAEQTKRREDTLRGVAKWSKEAYSEAERLSGLFEQEMARRALLASDAVVVDISGNAESPKPSVKTVVPVAASFLPAERRRVTSGSPVRSRKSSDDTDPATSARLEVLNRSIINHETTYPRLEASPDSSATRELVANLLRRRFGGNLGAFYEMLNLLPGVIVTDEDRTETRAALFTTVNEMVKPSVSSTLPEEQRLDIDKEARWLVMLCGKELVVQGDERFVKSSKRPFGTIQDIRNYVYLEHVGVSPNEAEWTVLAALGKVVQYE